MKSIFEYDNYRTYLADYYKKKKAQVPGYSYSVLAHKAGLPDKSTIYGAITGRRNLSGKIVPRLSRALDLNRHEAEYFENLVALNQARGLVEKNLYFERLNRVRSSGQDSSETRQLRNDQFEYYSTWYHSAIRSLIDLYPFKDNYKWLAKNLRPAVTSAQAKKAVDLLARLELIRKNKEGIYQLTEKNITTGKEVTNLAVLNFQKECIRLASTALDTMSRDKNITGLTVGISEAMYQKIINKIGECRSQIIEMVNNDTGSDRVYQMNFHLFPLSNIDNKGE